MKWCIVVDGAKVGLERVVVSNWVSMYFATTKFSVRYMVLPRADRREALMVKLSL